MAATLQTGGLMSMDSNPGAATPESLYRMYKDIAACSGNPYILRKITADRDAEVGARHANPQGQMKRHQYAQVSECSNYPIMTPSVTQHVCEARNDKSALTGMFRVQSAITIKPPGVAYGGRPH